ncbi:MAG: hypothetical protein IJS57_02365 [Paludibacteraceae bacterium]|nr:hypothetical protein [Paludibacteraceae bacterium]
MWTKFRFLTILAALSFALTLSATTFEYTSQASDNQTIDGITVVLAAGTNKQNAPTYLDNGYTKAMRLYVNNTITVSGENLTSIQLLCSKTGKAFAALTCSIGAYTPGEVPTKEGLQAIDTWSGNATSVTFTMGSGQRHLIQIVVNGDPIDLNPQSDVVAIDTAEWDPDFAWYSEPTAVITPDTTFFKKEYIFVSSNIRVHCTQGSILSNDTAYYFNCNAGQTISFEAAKPIKGLVINGAVRKLFQATSDQGSMAYISPDDFYPEDYQECESAVIITDIDAKKVTISCEKQLRCYSVYFYFDANPTQEIGDCDGGTSGGETVFLNFDTADAVYESEISADEGKTNYTIYLYNQASPDFPYLTLDLYPAAQGDLVGIYNMEDGSLGETTWYQYGESAYDRTWMETEGQLVINKEGEVYSISGYITCDDNNTYNFTYNGVMPFYEDTEYYSTEGIETVPAMDRHAPLYDVLGRKVNDTYKGIVIQNGYKYVLK